MSWEKLLVEQSGALHLHHGEAVSRAGAINLCASAALSVER